LVTENSWLISRKCWLFHTFTGWKLPRNVLAGDESISATITLFASVSP
jgi:hypothetical protein